MHDDYLFQRSPQERSVSGWQGYRGAVPAKVTMGLLGAGLLWHLVLLVGKLLAPSAFDGVAAAGIATAVTMVFYALTAVAFVVWFYLAYRTVNLAEGTAHSPDQAVWTFFVPILNIFRPYQIATEIWRKSSASGESHGHSGLLIAWWALWVIGRGCPLFVGTSLIRESGSMVSPVVIGLGLAELALSGAAIAVVRTLDGRIRARQGQGTAPATF